MLGRLVIAAFLSGLVGLEREFAAKPAGRRTLLNLSINWGIVFLVQRINLKKRQE